MPATAAALAALKRWAPASCCRQRPSRRLALRCQTHAVQARLHPEDHCCWAHSVWGPRLHPLQNCAQLLPAALDASHLLLPELPSSEGPQEPLPPRQSGRSLRGGPAACRTREQLPPLQGGRPRSAAWPGTAATPAPAAQPPPRPAAPRPPAHRAALSLQGSMSSSAGFP